MMVEVVVNDHHRHDRREDIRHSTMVHAGSCWLSDADDDVDATMRMAVVEVMMRRRTCFHGDNDDHWMTMTREA
ncbi:hypothetical protein D3C80_1944820 [compost metagenome]